MRCLFVAQNARDGDPTSRSKPMALLLSQEEFDAFVEKFFPKGIHYGMDGKVNGFSRFIQEYDPLYYNGTATRLFERNKIQRYPGDDCGGFLGNVLFY